MALVKVKVLVPDLIRRYGKNIICMPKTQANRFQDLGLVSIIEEIKKEDDIKDTKENKLNDTEESIEGIFPQIKK